ncbi:sortase A [Lachnospiraceae bacterium RM5]|nr:sortase A [Lachnospiraceae bacterium RM5]
MKRLLYKIITSIIFIAGLLVIIYPFYMDYRNQKKQKEVIVEYKNTIGKMTDEEMNELLEEAEKYNEELSKHGESRFYDDNITEGYEDILDPSGRGIIGYIIIPKIEVELPIYHGTKESILQVAAGHLKGSSFPIGGESTHSVIAGHRGLPTASLFTHIDELKKGDYFEITVLNRTVTYEVDDISVVKPEEIKNLKIVEGQDYTTLLTCTPYGINTHRLLVRGKRILDEEKVHEVIKDEINKVSDLMMISIIIVIFIIGYICFRIVRRVRKKRHLSK